jgi:post-segregation antitoxin (ccd killing protein)
VTINPEIFQMGRDEGYNFSQLLEEAIIERSDPRKEIRYLEGVVSKLETELAGYREKIKVLEKAEVKIKRTVFDELLEQAKPIYECHGYVDHDLLKRFSIKLNKSVDELEEDVIYAFSK